MSATISRSGLLSNQKAISLLRQKIQSIENKKPVELNIPDCQISGQTKLKNIISLGTPEIDVALPWNGLPTNGLHEIFGDTAALGFLLTLITRLTEFRSQAGHNSQILWCQRGLDLYGQGLAHFGIDLSQTILVHGKNDKEILWVMEEGLRSSGLTAVIGKLYKVPPIASRRLHLAAEENGTTGLLLRAKSNDMTIQLPTNSALTRWRVTSAPGLKPIHGVGLGASQWHLELQRCRLSAAQGEKLESAGQSKSWQVKWCDETSTLSVVTNFCDRPNQTQNLQKITG
jgi:protein ImuA